MNHHARPRLRAVLAPIAPLALLTLGLSACQEYDAPPQPEIVQPASGAWTEGDPVQLTFSEPIDAATLKINVRGAERDKEGAFVGDPLITECTVEQGTCGDMSMTLSEDRKTLELAFDTAGLGGPGPPLFIEVLSGLKDDAGRPTGVSHTFNIQYKLTDYVNTEPVPFEDGIYIIAGQAKVSSFDVTLLLYTDIRAMEDGTLSLAAVKGQVIDGPRRLTTNPDELEVDTNPKTSFSIFAKGYISYKDGRRYLETEKFDVDVPVLGTARAILKDTRLVGEFTADANNNNHDRFDGSLSYGDAILVTTREISLGGDSADLVAAYVPEEKVPEGVPDMCDNPCGGNTGVCDVPGLFPSEGICAAPE